MRSDSPRWAIAVGCALALLLPGCNGGEERVPPPTETIVGSGSIVSESRSLPPFDSVDASIGEAHIVITQGSRQALRIKTDDNIIGTIETVVSGSVLRIFSDAGYSTGHGVVIHIDMTAVRSLRFGGAGEMSATGIESSGTLEVVLAGIGSIQLAGTVDTCDAVVERIGDIDAEKLTSRLADIELWGIGDCRITVTDQLNGSIFGEGNIYYAGNPPIVTPCIIGVGRFVPI
jgi:hypothetical protein